MVSPIKEISKPREPLMDATGCLASAWARLAADLGDAEATRILAKEWECRIPEEVIQAGVLKKARFAHLS